jgi:sucrose-6-phosphate hydrolase SacC (GH32 family)
MNSSTARAYWPLNEGRGKTAREDVSGFDSSIHYVFNDAKYKPPSDPMWRKGVNGEALLCDGYSTWIAHPRARFETPVEAFTVAAWVAPRTFEAAIGGQLSAIVNQHDRLAEQGFIVGTSTHGAWSLQIGTGRSWHEIWSSEALLPRHEWAFVVATFHSVSGSLCLYLDGERVARDIVERGALIQPAVKDVLIGRHNEPVQLSAFEANLFDGLIDSVGIDGVAWDAAHVKSAYLDALRPHGGAKPLADTRPRRSRYDGDIHRPQYHFIPPQHWMNEPHAILHFRGKYHVMYQHNAHGPFWHNITWGHAISDDLVHWKDLPDAIVTQRGSVAPDGVWSGSASTNADGNPVLFFTAGNFATSPNQATGLARSTFATDSDDNLTHWTLHDSPVTTLDRKIEVMGRKLLPDEFRDPFVWREDGFWCQLVGAGVQDIGGTALLYTSDDLVNWTYRKPFMVGDMTRFPVVSMMWELPVFLPVGEGKHIFLFSPWWAPGYPSAHFLKYVPYWIGTWDVHTLTFTPDHEKPQIFDYGQHFTGPSGTVDANGRTIIFNIAQTKRDAQMSYDLGWDGNAGLPLELFMRSGELRLRPATELESLRGQHLVSLSGVSLAAANAALSGVGGGMLEIHFELAVPVGERIEFAVRRSATGEESTAIFYDRSTCQFGIDRERSSLSDTVHQRGVQSGPLDIGEESFNLHIYLDRSMIEAYANERKSITSRIYPRRADATGLQLFGDEGWIIKRLDIWKMCSAYND